MELTLTRTFDAPRELVWRAWTDPDQMSQWWGPRGISTPRESIVMDLRPGGTIRFEMVDDATGERYPNSGTFVEIEPPALIVWADDGFADGSGTGTARITFEALDERRTRLTLHLDADFDEAVRAGAEQGWGTSLDKLVQLLQPAPGE